MNNITTLENVYQRVDNMFQTCHDSLIPVKNISFDDLDTIKIAGSVHPLKKIPPCKKPDCFNPDRIIIQPTPHSSFENSSDPSGI